MNYPQIIQGGMGVGVSGWRLARAVCLQGQLGVVSGTALDVVLTRRLQIGDPGGHMRQALRAFPDQNIAQRLLDRYFIAEGKAPDKPFISKPMVGQKLSPHAEELLVAANFAEVFLAKQGHDGKVGVNYLHKIQAPLVASLYGAILAGVDVVIVGAGIPFDIPGILDRLCYHETAYLKLHVHEAESEKAHTTSFNPKEMFGETNAPLHRPLFFPIVASATLASLMVKKCEGKVDGLIIEGPLAGGHNAPPRGKAKFNAENEPVYGPRDQVDLKAIETLGLPFWLAGSYASATKFAQTLAAGAAGIQVGTLFAFCEESGLRNDLKQEVIERCQNESPRVFTDPVASPTGFPFKVLSVPGTLSQADVYAKRNRLCDLGYLREAYEKPDGSLGWRCPAEETQAYVDKGGLIEDTVGRKCLCNGLMANIGLPQIRGDHEPELPLLTCGNDVASIRALLNNDATSYTASDVIRYLLTGNTAETLNNA